MAKARPGRQKASGVPMDTQTKEEGLKVVLATRNAG
jgi:hypothetical protein